MRISRQINLSPNLAIQIAKFSRSSFPPSLSNKHASRQWLECYYFLRGSRIAWKAYPVACFRSQRLLHTTLAEICWFLGADSGSRNLRNSQPEKLDSQPCQCWTHFWRWNKHLLLSQDIPLCRPPLWGSLAIISKWDFHASVKLGDVKKHTMKHGFYSHLYHCMAFR